MKTAFCGPCFGAGDVPAHNGLSLRHTTRNFENREGSRPADGQLAAVALMDARSIAATALNGGAITPATEVFCRKPRKNTVTTEKSMRHASIGEMRIPQNPSFTAPILRTGPRFPL